MMPTLRFEILSYWQVGSGTTEMGTFDSRAARDALDLPMIPGKQVKGLCRQAVVDALSIKVPDLPEDSETTLFGTRALIGQPLLDNPSPANLRFDDARLPQADRDALAGKPERIAQLFRTRRSTAMTPEGVAKPHSLRFDEIVIPLTLEAEVTPLDGAPPDWEARLTKALPLLNAVGSGRTRGTGRVIVSFAGAIATPPATATRTEHVGPQRPLARPHHEGRRPKKDRGR